MRMVKLVQVLWTLALAAVVLLPLAGVASANVNDVSTERTGSIIVFPKVVWDGTRDTIIQVTNTTTSLVLAHCFYVNGADPTQCSETDFDLWLTRYQPTHWVVSTGRFTYLGRDLVDASFDHDANSAGFSPGLIPPVPEGFIGELKCVQIDQGGVPLRGNALKGEATIRSLSGDVSEYNAIAFRGNPRFDVSDPRSTDSYDLTLDLTPRTGPYEEGGDNTGKYSACPDTLLLNHFNEGSPDDVISQLGECDPVCIAGDPGKIGTTCTLDQDCSGGGGRGVCGGCPIDTELTLIPCSEDFENQAFKAMTVQFLITDETELRYSASIKVNCYLNVSLRQIAGFPPLPTLGAYTRITTDAGKCDVSRGVCISGSAIGSSCGSNTDCPSSGGVIGLAEELRAESTSAGLGPKAAAAYNIQTEGNRFDAATNGDGSAAGGFIDHIIIPQP